MTSFAPAELQNPHKKSSGPRLASNKKVGHSSSFSLQETSRQRSLGNTGLGQLFHLAPETQRTPFLARSPEPSLQKRPQNEVPSLYLQRTPNKKQQTSGLTLGNTLPPTPELSQPGKQFASNLDLYQGVGPLMASALGSVTLDGFETGKAKISEGNQKKLAETAKRILKLLEKFPASTIRITGHTDAIDSDESNLTLGQKRADATAAALNALGVPTDDIKTVSKGESELLINTKNAEAQNRRVDVRFEPFVSRLTFSGPKLTPPWQNPSPDGPKAPRLGLPPNFTLDPSGIPFGPTPAIPKAKLRNWLEESLKRDPLLKKLPNWMRDKVVDGLKNADEKVAEKIIDALPLGGKEKTALKAVAKSILQLLKGKKFKMTIPPPRGLDSTIPPFKFPKMPGEVIIKGPGIRF